MPCAAERLQGSIGGESLRDPVQRDGAAGSPESHLLRR